MPKLNKFVDQPCDNMFGAAVKLWWDAFGKRSKLCDAHLETSRYPNHFASP
jgi:hypothetical protein